MLYPSSDLLLFPCYHLRWTTLILWVRPDQCLRTSTNLSNFPLFCTCIFWYVGCGLGNLPIPLVVSSGLHSFKSEAPYRRMEVTMKMALKTLSIGCCQTNEPKHQYLVDGYFYEITKERHSLRAASRFSLNVLRFDSDLCELNRL